MSTEVEEKKREYSADKEGNLYLHLEQLEPVYIPLPKGGKERVGEQMAIYDQKIPKDDVPKLKKYLQEHHEGQLSQISQNETELESLASVNTALIDENIIGPLRSAINTSMQTKNPEKGGQRAVVQKAQLQALARVVQKIDRKLNLQKAIIVLKEQEGKMRKELEEIEKVLVL